MDASWLSTIWYIILSLTFFIYIILDGFDLGAGILALFSRREEFKGQAMGSLGAVWHANQTWLIVFGGCLFGAFPLVYGLVLSALYIPVILMLIGLIVRGMALEFYESSEGKPIISLFFGLGSLLAALAQGAGVGAWLWGFSLKDGKFTGGVWEWLTPFPVFIAIGLVIFYSLLGATRLMAKTEAEHFQFSRRAALIASYLGIAAAVGVVIWAGLARPVWAAGWFIWPYFTWTFLPLVLGALAFIPLIIAIRQGREREPYMWTAVSVGCLFFGLAAGVYPRIIPPDVTVSMAASPAFTLTVMLVGVGLMLPLMFIYNFYMYRVFRGRPQAGQYDRY